MTAMRAVRQDELGGPEVLRLVKAERPEPAYGEILVKVHAAGLNPVDGKVRADGGLSGEAPPYGVGWDVSGTVAAVGPGVQRFRVGEGVYGMPRFPVSVGAYAEYVTGPTRHFSPKPAGLSHVEAAALPLAGLTAYQSLVDFAQIRAGQRVLIHAAAGGVGHLAVQLAKAKGAFVIGTASAAKHDYLKGIGADEVVDYTAVDFAAVVGEVDIVLDGVGGDYSRRSAPIVRDGGVLVMLPGPVDLPESEHARIRAGWNAVEPDPLGLAALTELVEAGKLKPTVSQTFGLEDAAKAHELLDSGRTIGKIVLTVA